MSKKSLEELILSERVRKALNKPNQRLSQTRKVLFEARKGKTRARRNATITRILLIMSCVLGLAALVASSLGLVSFITLVPVVLVALLSIVGQQMSKVGQKARDNRRLEVADSYEWRYLEVERQLVRLKHIRDQLATRYHHYEAKLTRTIDSSDSERASRVLKLSRRRQLEVMERLKVLETRMKQMLIELNRASILDQFLELEAMLELNADELSALPNESNKLIHELEDIELEFEARNEVEELLR